MSNEKSTAPATLPAIMAAFELACSDAYVEVEALLNISELRGITELSFYPLSADVCEEDEGLCCILEC
jgi:hypothetical protein